MKKVLFFVFLSAAAAVFADSLPGIGLVKATTGVAAATTKAVVKTAVSITSATTATAARATAAATHATVTTAAVATKPTMNVAAAAAKPERDPDMLFCLFRGFCNLTTGWIELPRCIVYDLTFSPFFGLFIGIPKGTFLTVGRTCCGVYDILSLGFSGRALHSEAFPDTVFESKWIYRK